MKLSAASKFCHRFGTGLKAGVDIVRALESEASHSTGRQSDAMKKLVQGVKQGEQLCDVMKRDKFFPPVMTSMVRVGEETGRLERTMFMLSNHYQHLLDSRRIFVRSIAWPMLQLVAAIGILSLLIYLMGILTPAGGGQMTDILGFGLRGGSGVLIFWLYVGAAFGGIALLVWAYLRNVAGVQNLIPIIYAIPKLGDSIQTITISRFCWTLALALDAGLDPIRSIRLALESTDSDYYRAGADKAESAIRGGATLSGTFEATELFPPDFIGRVEISEHSGTDAESMEYLAKEYDERAKTALRVLSGVATIIIRVSVVIVFVFLIFRIAMTYINALNGAMEPI